MLCQRCYERIEVGEAYVMVYSWTGLRQLQKPYHAYCNVREYEDARQEHEEFERLANEARKVC